MTAPDLIRDELTRAARDLGAPDSVAPVLERPRDPSFGEWTTNLAMTLAKPLKRKPQEIAHDLIGRMNLKRATVSDAYVAGPGFINFRLDAGTVAAGCATSSPPTRSTASRTSGRVSTSTWSSCPRTRLARCTSVTGVRRR